MKLIPEPVWFIKCSIYKTHEEQENKKDIFTSRSQIIHDSDPLLQVAKQHKYSTTSKCFTYVKAQKSQMSINYKSSPESS